MADYVISDTHFFDPIIIRHTKRGEVDPLTGKFSLFKDEYCMNRHMIEQWNSVVGKKDRVFHLGDFCSRCTPEQANVIFKNLNGRIVLIAGNHDIETEGLMVILKKLPFENIIDFPIVYGRYVFSHRPLRRSGTFINVHGHSHGKSEIGIDVSAELLNYRPVSINELMGKKQVSDPNPFNERISDDKITSAKENLTKNNKPSRWNRNFLKTKRKKRKNNINHDSDGR